MAENLSIHILAQLDEALSKTTIETQLRKIAKDLKIDIGFDDNALKRMAKEIQELQTKVNDQSKKIKIIDEDSVKSGSVKIQRSIQDAIKEAKKFGDVNFKETFDPVTKELQGFTLEAKKGKDVVKQLKYEMVKISDGKGGFNNAFKLSGLKESNREATTLRNSIDRANESAYKFQQNWKSGTDKLIQAEREQFRQVKSRLALYQQEARIKAQDLKTRYGNNIDDTAIRKYLESVNKLKTSTPRLNSEMARLNTELRQTAANARQAQAATGGLAGAFSNAISKFSIWMGASTLFFGTFSMIREITEDIFEIDKAMTELMRVMDAPPDTFNQMLQDSIRLSNELGNNLKDVMGAVNGFARQGFSQDEIMNLTRAATVASNVSELTAEEAMDDLTGAMTQFNIEAKDSLEVVDRLNEVDNNFAVTTKDLSVGLHKAGATARTFGVTIDEVLGNLTSIISTTRESGSVVGNSLKSIYSRVTTIKAASDVLADVGVSTEDMTGNVRNVTDILDDLAGKWNTISKSQQQNIAVTVAGRFLKKSRSMETYYCYSVNAIA